MTNYKDRWLIQVDSVRGDMDSPRKDLRAHSDMRDAVIDVNQVDRYQNVYLVDRALQTSHFADVRAYGQGYYGLKFREEDTSLSAEPADASLNHYMDGVIDRLGDEALDRLDLLMYQKRDEHEDKIAERARARGGEELLSELRREKYMAELKRQREEYEARTGEKL
jgi:hypothetical protein